jgi:hypothetical protein
MSLSESSINVLQTVLTSRQAQKSISQTMGDKFQSISHFGRTNDVSNDVCIRGEIICIRGKNLKNVNTNVSAGAPQCRMR